MAISCKHDPILPPAPGDVSYTANGINFRIY